MVRRIRTIAIATAAVVVVAAAAGGQTRTAGREHPERFGFGRPATHAEIDAWDIDVMPNGQGLPAGRGTAATGEAIYLRLCASCHGREGEGATAAARPCRSGGRDPRMR